jgi:metallo-beta-lactamase class B
MVFASSINPISSDGFRFSDPAGKVFLEAFGDTFTRLRMMPCDMLITAHPQQSDGEAKFAKLRKARHPNPYWDSKACKTYADAHEALLKQRLAREAAER